MWYGLDSSVQDRDQWMALVDTVRVHKLMWNSRVTERQVASHEGLSSMELAVCDNKFVLLRRFPWNAFVRYSTFTYVSADWSLSAHAIKVKAQWGMGKWRSRSVKTSVIWRHSSLMGLWNTDKIKDRQERTSASRSLSATKASVPFLPFMKVNDL
jgi:hypothetical protein